MADPKTVVSWSGGKDAAYALLELGTDSVAELLTTISENGRSSMHGVRRELYEKRAESIGLPIRFVELPLACSNEEYESRMANVMAEYESRGIDRVAFADLYLEDIRRYREYRLEKTSIDGCWPVWNPNTEEQIESFLDAGFRATVVAVDDSLLDSSFVGRELDPAFLADLPRDIDPCGKNGEFHTFVRDGPIFDSSISVEDGKTVTREVGDGEFHYCDLR
ncbi:adenine nucleotide alpha hydrolase [Haladaptatus caseinilyticus]|uniref:adenine nucleotide alpha hydrolase n=1 Tax=Haladaptatus caseinilyticus TaxID=2993314 RepID=UPI00224A85C2|nr:adenine nucleotide alpha hydrolase [Haladaptatus caseinilyticus]